MRGVAPVRATIAAYLPGISPGTARRCWSAPCGSPKRRRSQRRRRRRSRRSCRSACAATLPCQRSLIATRGMSTIRRGERAPLDDPHAERPEVLGRDGGDLDGVARNAGLMPPGNPDLPPVRVQLHRYSCRKRDRFDAGNRRDLRDRLIVEARGLGRRVPQRARVGGHCRQVLDGETGIGPLRRDEAAREQCGDDEQQRVIAIWPATSRSRASTGVRRRARPSPRRADPRPGRSGRLQRGARPASSAARNGGELNARTRPSIRRSKRSESAAGYKDAATDVIHHASGVRRRRRAVTAPRLR